MRLIFIRHGDPDYTIDSLTPLGKEQVKALGKRAASWKVDEIYRSPMGRAKLTCDAVTEALGMEATMYPWLQEFDYPVEHPYIHEKTIGWDLMPQYWTNDPIMLDPDRWYEANLYRQNPDIACKWHEVTEGLDAILLKHGYENLGPYYNYRNPDGPDLEAGPDQIQISGVDEYQVRDEDDEKTIAFVCHLGVIFVMLAHLMHVSPVLMWHTAYLPPTGLVVVNAEKRLHNATIFRMQEFGDVEHLKSGNVAISGKGAFSTLFKG